MRRTPLASLSLVTLLATRSAAQAVIRSSKEPHNGSA